MPFEIVQSPAFETDESCHAKKRKYYHEHSEQQSFGIPLEVQLMFYLKKNAITDMWTNEGRAS